MDFAVICLAWINDHIRFIHGGWYIMDNEGGTLEGPYADRYDDDLERISMEYAVEYAEPWWEGIEEETEYEGRSEADG